MYDHARLFHRVDAAVQADSGASLRTLAHRLRVHPHTLAAVVRAQTGRTFSAWRDARRLERASVLLRTRADLSIKEIAAALGFNSTSVFDRFLKRVCGRSPSACRRHPDPRPSADAEGASRVPVPAGHEAAAVSNVNVIDTPSTLNQVHHCPANATLDSCPLSFARRARASLPGARSDIGGLRTAGSLDR
jgi:AraC-like DNA-binding protein